MSLLCSVSDDLRIWKYEDQIIAPISHFKAFRTSNCIAWNHTNQVIAAGGVNSEIYLIQSSNGQILSTLQLDNITSKKLKVNTVSFSGNSRYLASAVDHNIQLWDLKRRSIKTTFKGHNAIATTSSFLSDGSIVSGDRDGIIKLWNPKVNITSEDMRCSTGDAGVTSIAVSPISSASLLAAGYTDGSLSIWDPSVTKLMRTLQCHNGTLTALSYSPKNPRLVATAGSDGRVALMDTGARGAGAPSASIDLGESLGAVSFNSDAIHCAIGAANGRLLVYDWRNVRRPVTSVSAHGVLGVQALAFQIDRSLSKDSAPSVDSSTISIPRSSIDSAPSIPSMDSSRKHPILSPNRAVVSEEIGASSLRISPEKLRVSSESKSTEHPIRNDMSHNHTHTITSPKFSDSNIKSELYNDDEFMRSIRREVAARGSSVADTIMPPPVPANEGISPKKSLLSSTDSHSPSNSGLNTPQEDTHKYTPSKSDFNNRSDRGPQTPFSRRKPDAEHNDNEIDTQKKHPTLETSRDTNRITNNREKQMGKKYYSFNPFGSAAEEAAIGNDVDQSMLQEFSSLRNAMRPVNMRDFEEALQMLRYDIHREVQDIIKEQVRQFSIAKDDTAQLLKAMRDQMNDLLKANKELREENEYLRRIY